MKSKLDYTFHYNNFFHRNKINEKDANGTVNKNLHGQ